MKKGKAKRKRKSDGSFRCLVFALILFCLWIFSTFTITVNEVEISDEKIRDEVTIVHLSDLHGSVFGINNSSVINAIKRADPDFVVVTGDMYTSGSDEGRETSLRLMKNISKNYTVYYVNGEHDNDEDFFDELRKNSVKVLDYKSDDIAVGETKLTLYGITNVYYSPTFDLTNEFSLNRDRYNILLAHTSNKVAFADFGLDLGLCGDTHGGQVRLPLIGGLYGTNGWLPEVDDKDAFIKGLYKYENTDFYISSGLGNFPIPLRFLNRPEIAVIKLVSENI